MSDFYDELQADAGDLLAELGRKVTLVRSTFVTDLVEGTSVRTVSATDELDALKVPMSERLAEKLDVRFMDNVGDVRELRLYLVSAVGSTFEPAPKDQMLVDDDTWEVIGCTAVAPADTAVLYAVGVVLP